MNLIHKTAEIDKKAKIGQGTKIWNNAQIREKAKIGKNCIIGKDVYIDHDVEIGDNCRIQNQALIYYRTKLFSNVFIGPQVCFANDKLPRVVLPDGSPRTFNDWQPGEIIVEEGASIGAGSILLPDIKIGAWAMIGAGSVVLKSVPSHGLVYGNPAKLNGYVCFCGNRLTELKANKYKCSACKRVIKIA